jgi:hypothetical protein
MGVAVAVVLIASMAAWSPASLATARAAAPAAPAPRLFYTTNYPAALKVVNYSTSGDQLRVGSIKVVASLPGADGLGVASDGHLIVGGAATSKVFDIDPSTGHVQTVTAFPNAPAAYHITVSPDGSTAYTAGLPGQLGTVPLRPFGPGKAVNVKGDDTKITTVGFTPFGAFYTSSSGFGTGSFGTLDLATMTTKRVFANLRGAHGMSYDPYTKDLFLFGSFAIVQVDPRAILQPSPDHSNVIVSQRTIENMAFDQGLADGHGHLLVASNNGTVYFVDYAATGLISTATALSHNFLDTNLDDIATVTLASPPVAAKPAAHKSSSGTSLIVVIGLIVVVVVGVGLVIRSRRTQSQTGRGDAATF